MPSSIYTIFAMRDKLAGGAKRFEDPSMHSRLPG
jgi:hypothetical protein